jgi:tight adherence protein C
MATLISIFIFLILGSVIILFGYRAYVLPARFFEQLTPVQDVRKRAAGPGGKRVAVRLIAQIGATVPVSREDSTMARRYLTAAGYRSEKAVTVYYGIKVAISVVAVVASLFLVPHATARPVLRIRLYVAACAGGFFCPNLILEHMVAARQRRLRISLPDALDLMVIAVEPGLGMDQAFVTITKELRNTHKDVTDEFALVSLEMRAGQRRIDALHNLAVRTGEAEVRKLVAVLAQTDRFGTSIADALRTHADYMRVTRRLKAEERAGKLGVKLVFPIFFLVMPSMALVVAGPGLLEAARLLLPALHNVK